MHVSQAVGKWSTHVPCLRFSSDDWRMAHRTTEPFYQVFIPTRQINRCERHEHFSLNQQKLDRKNPSWSTIRSVHGNRIATLPFVTWASIANQQTHDVYFFSENECWIDQKLNLNKLLSCWNLTWERTKMAWQVRVTRGRSHLAKITRCELAFDWCAKWKRVQTVLLWYKDSFESYIPFQSTMIWFMLKSAPLRELR